MNSVGDGIVLRSNIGVSAKHPKFSVAEITKFDVMGICIFGSSAMTYENAFDCFDEAIASVNRRTHPELWHLMRGLRAFSSAVQRDLNDLKGRHEKTHSNVAKVNAEVTVAQSRLNDILKGLE